MNKKNHFTFPVRTIIIAALLCFQNIIFSQHASSDFHFKSPRFFLELSGSFNVPVGSARGEMADFFSFKNYGLVHGIGFDLEIGYAADKKSHLFPYISAGFVHLQNDDVEHAYIDSNNISYGYPLPGSQIYNSTSGTSVLVLQNIHFGVGVLYFYSPNTRVSPFCSAELNYNYLSGYYEQESYPLPGRTKEGKTEFDIKKTRRIGVGVSLGFNYRLTDELGFMFGAKYIVANVFGKESVKTDAASVNPGDKNTMYLLDAAASELNSNLSSNRSISYFQFKVGFSVFVGKK